jgi:hypothetical protein
MMTISFARHQFPPAIIWHAVAQRFLDSFNRRGIEISLACDNLSVEPAVAHLLAIS